MTKLCCSMFLRSVAAIRYNDYVMEDMHKQALGLQAEIKSAAARIGVESLVAHKNALDEQISRPDFWQNAQKAQEVSKQQAKLEQRVTPWLALAKDADDLVELSGMNDESMYADLAGQLAQVIGRFAALKEELKFAGPFDDHDAILNIYAGAGGTDAQEWAQMLMRMYVRWAEANGYEVE